MLRFYKEFLNSLELGKDDYVLLDPPYLISQSEYNKLWNEEDEKELYKLLDRLNEKGIRFGITNLVYHKGKKNAIFEKRGFENLTSQQKDLIVKATCLQAEYIKEEGLCDDNSISSYSIGGDLTVNEKESQDMADKLNISKLAFFYLKRTGLTTRII